MGVSRSASRISLIVLLLALFGVDFTISEALTKISFQLRAVTIFGLAYSGTEYIYCKLIQICERSNFKCQFIFSFSFESHTSTLNSMHDESPWMLSKTMSEFEALSEWHYALDIIVHTFFYRFCFLMTKS